MEILHIENLNFRYPKSGKNALKDISFHVNAGEFVVICGESGCGKTTLLKLLKQELAPVGEKSGYIFYQGTEQQKLDQRQSACEIGFVLQNPDNQIVTDKVWHELSFGLENMGVPTGEIRRKVGEMASYFGIQNWFRCKTDELSGGQKQLLNLASVMVMQPKILILDEPTSQLDPIAASEFIATLQKLNRELGLTILLVEHRLEEVFPVADKVLLMDGGKILLYDTPKNMGLRLNKLQKNHPMMLGLPSAVRIFQALDVEDECPLTVREGRDFLERHFKADGQEKYEKLNDCDENNYESFNEKRGKEIDKKVVVELKNAWFRYEKNLPDIMRGVSLQVMKGEFYCLLGGNGTGKTTTLNVISGLNKPYRGKVMIDGKLVKDYRQNSLYRNMLAFLPQNPQTVFLKDNVRDDFSEILQALEVPKKSWEVKINQIAQKVGIAHLLDKHPYDLSGGEQQKCALAKMLLLEPKILLLDEPTKGLDAYSKYTLSLILKELQRDGLTILMVTHDVEFAAENADRCALFFDGEIISSDVPSKFFTGNNFYTTAASRIARQLYPDAVTCDAVVSCCRRKASAKHFL